MVSLSNHEGVPRSLHSLDLVLRQAQDEVSDKGPPYRISSRNAETAFGSTPFSMNA
jgi:hypothetical protein